MSILRKATLGQVALALWAMEQANVTPTPLARAFWCVKHDRAACNDGRWVRRRMNLAEVASLSAIAAHSREPEASRLWAKVFRATCPTYRWEYRR